jgi:hypothetical protein
MSIKIQGTEVITDDKSFVIGSGNTAQRPGAPEQGILYYNTELSRYERFNGSTWDLVSGSAQHDQFARGFSSAPGSSWTDITQFFDGSTVLSQSQNPDLFSRLGVVENNNGRVWSATYTTPTAGDAFTGLCYGNGIYLLVSDTGRRTSTDAITWSTVSGLSNQTTCAFGAGVFVSAYIYANTIASSTDAISWTTRTSGASGTINKIRFLNDRFVATGAAGYISTSTAGVTWSVRTSGTTTVSINDSAFGNGVYVVVGAGGYIRSSTNGISWTARTSVSANIINTVIFANGVFIAAGTGGHMQSSTDGITWNWFANTPVTDDINSIGYGNNTLLLHANVPFKRDQIYRSVDQGLSWTEHLLSSVRNPKTPVIEYYNDTFMCLVNYEPDIFTNPTGAICQSGKYTYNPTTEFVAPKIDSANIGTNYAQDFSYTQLKLYDRF